MPGGGLARGPAAFAILVTFCVMVYLSLRQISAKLKIAVGVAYIVAWVLFFLGPDAQSVWAAVLGVVLVYTVGHVAYVYWTEYM